MVDVNTPLKYHMNDLVYYLGASTGGSLGKQISFLGAIGAMTKGMLYKYNPDDPRIQSDPKLRGEFLRIQTEVNTFVGMVDLLSSAYFPLIDTNPYLYKRAARVRKGVQIAQVFAYHLIEQHNLVSGNMIRGKLAEHFGADRIKGMTDDNTGGNEFA